MFLSGDTLCVEFICWDAMDISSSKTSGLRSKVNVPAMRRDYGVHFGLNVLRAHRQKQPGSKGRSQTEAQDICATVYVWVEQFGTGAEQISMQAGSVWGRKREDRVFWGESISKSEREMKK